MAGGRSRRVSLPSPLSRRRRSLPSLLKVVSSATSSPGRSANACAAALLMADWTEGLLERRLTAVGNAMHVLKRLLLAVIAYLLAVLAGLIAIIVIYLVLSSMPGAPSYFSAVTLSPIVIIAVPPIGALVYGLAIMLTALPALVGAVVTELFALRQAWLHGVMAAAIGGGAFVFASPLLLLGEIDGTDWADLAIVAAGGICRRPRLLADRRTQGRLPAAGTSDSGVRNCVAEQMVRGEFRLRLASRLPARSRGVGAGPNPLPATFSP